MKHKPDIYLDVAANLICMLEIFSYALIYFDELKRLNYFKMKSFMHEEHNFSIKLQNNEKLIFLL